MNFLARGLLEAGKEAIVGEICEERGRTATAASAAG